MIRLKIEQWFLSSMKHPIHYKTTYLQTPAHMTTCCLMKLPPPIALLVVVVGGGGGGNRRRRLRASVGDHPHLGLQPSL